MLGRAHEQCLHTKSFYCLLFFSFSEIAVVIIRKAAICNKIDKLGNYK